MWKGEEEKEEEGKEDSDTKGLRMRRDRPGCKLGTFVVGRGYIKRSREWAGGRVVNVKSAEARGRKRGARPTRVTSTVARWALALARMVHLGQ